jgi:hypothetical protein
MAASTPKVGPPPPGPLYAVRRHRLDFVDQGHIAAQCGHRQSHAIGSNRYPQPSQMISPGPRS